MDAKLIYTATHYLLSKIEWDSLDDNEWIHFGTEKELKADLVNTLIQRHFVGEDTMLCVLGRHDSQEVNPKHLQEVVNPLLGKVNFYLWNKRMKKVMEFNTVGILRQGFIKE
jgi:hypothetical protein